MRLPLEFQEELRACTDVEELHKPFFKACDRLGFGIAKFAFNENRACRLRVSNFPSAWEKRYQERDYRSLDPYVSYLNRHPGTTMIYWPDVIRQQELSAEQALSIHEAGEFDLNIGVSSSSAAFQGRHVGVSVIIDSRNIDRGRRYFEETGTAVVWLSAALQAWFDYIDPNRFAPLTEREREVLSWIAQGLNSESAADKLCMSKRTVDFHVTNSVTKLGVSNRIQAVAVALQRKLINP